MLLTADTPKRRSLKPLLWAVLGLPLTFAMLLLIRMPLSWSDQAIFGGLLIGCCIAVGRFSDSRYVTSLLTIVSVYCSLRYAVWRWSSSISYLNHSGWQVEWIGLVSALLLLGAESYSVVILLLGYFQSSKPLRRKPVTMPADISTWPAVDVYIPTYNEPLDVVRPTVLAAMGIDWPQDRMKVYILDDGRREEFRQFAEECGCGYLIRSNNSHAKAGNINAALKNTDGEFIAIFDCDHIATRSFLQLTMGWFGLDKKLAMVQTPHHFYSPDPFERNLNLFRKVPNEGSLFYGVVQDGNDLWNATFFCGSCAVIKRAALEQIGGIAVETVTEDAHTALRLQRLGWNTAYIGIPQAAGLATGSLSAHVGQRIRWARGMVQILRTEFPLFASGLSLAQRLCYLNCAMHYLYAIPRLVFVSAPLVYLIFGKSNLYGFLWEILAYAAPHLVLSNMVNSRCQGDHRHSFWNEVYEMVLAPYILLPTTFALINPKWGKFNVTAKSSVVDESFFDWNIARPYLFLLAINVVAIACAIPRYFTSNDPSGVLLMNTIWACLNSLMIGACIAVSFETKQRRATARVEATLSAVLTFPNEPAQHCQVIDLSEGGLALRAESAFHNLPESTGSVTIRAGAEEFQFLVETVRTSENRIHLRFPVINLNHQREITKLVYARADSWIDWNKDQKRDRIFSSLFHVFSIGAQGIWILPSLFIKREKKRPAPVGTKKLTLPETALPLLACVVALGFAAHGQAQTTATAAPVKTVAAAETNFEERQTFAELGSKAALLLNTDHPKNKVNFVLPSTKIVQSADMVINIHSGDLPSNENSELAVSLNGVEVGVLPVKDLVSLSEPIRMTLPSDLLVHENDFGFELREQCAAPCNKPAQAKTMGWIRVETASEVHTSGFVMSLPNRLSTLPAPFFDASLQRSVELPMVFEVQPDMPTLKAAGIIASWYGTLASYRGSHFATHFGQFPRGNAVLIAHSGSTLATTLGLPSNVAQIAMCDNPSDRYGKILAIVAPDEMTLVSLASLVAQDRLHVDSDRLTPSTQMLEQSNKTAAAKPNWSDARLPIQPTKDASEGMLHSRLGSPAKLYFRLAPDLEYGTKTTVPFRLAYKMTGLTFDDHVWLSIRMNNIFVTKRRLGARDAIGQQSQSFAIPVSLLYSTNTLEVNLSTDRLDTTVLDARAVDMQIQRNTELDLGNPVHFVQMPRLDLFAASGYPFTAKPDLADTTIVIPELPNGAQMALYLDAVGFLSAQTDVPSNRFNLVKPKDTRTGSNGNILVIASTNDDEPFRAFQRSMVVLPINGRFELGDTTLPLQEWLSRAWLGRSDQLGHLNQVMEGESSLTFLLEQFVSPYRRDRSVVVLATRSESDEHAYFERLSAASREGAISGGLTLGDSEHFTSFQITSHSYALGPKFSLGATYGWLRFHLWILPLGLIVAAGIVAFFWERYLQYQAERRLQAAA